MGMEKARELVEWVRQSREQFAQKMGGPEVVDWVVTEMSRTRSAASFRRWVVDLLEARVTTDAWVSRRFTRTLVGSEPGRRETL